MKICRIIATILLAAVMVFVLSGCAAQPAPAPAPADPPPQAADAAEPVAETDPLADLGNFPSGNISWIVSAPAGAPLDLPARAVIEVLDLGANIIIENIPGGANVIGTLEAFYRAADGYTILSANSGAMATQPALNDTGYTWEDFRHIALLTPVSPYAVFVRPDSGIVTPQDWLDFVQSGDSFTFSASNPGSHSHLTTEIVLDELGVTTGIFVPYVGGAEVIAAVQTGEIDFAVLGTVHGILTQEIAGNIRNVVLLHDVSDEAMPDLPLITDYGITRVGDFASFIFASVRADTPDAIVEFIKERIHAAMLTDEYQAFIQQTTGVHPFSIISEEELTAMVRNAWDTTLIALDEFNITD
ncbi:MAG: tripartite tricarboxylate transporter substrate binding protein [Defluviitaleaceae bacterium]|nr:tripartite tricarboxylate transporter substrate binding protein [Defluviitaleaceae bacterium]